jgi:predicted acylesterase/phospholipase RssA
MDAEDLKRRAQELATATVPPKAAEVREVADGLRDTRRTGAAATMLRTLARRALTEEWTADQRAELAIEVLRDHQQLGYARRLLARVRADPAHDSEQRRQQHALCTYKDLDLSAELRLDRALAILTDGAPPLDVSTDAETLGIAGAIYKRRWDVGARRGDLENALFCYRRGYDQQQDEQRWYAGINAAYAADRLAELEEQVLGGAQRAAVLRDEARTLRADIAQGAPSDGGGWNDATIGEALFGLREFGAAEQALAAVGAHKKDLWRQETNAMQLAAIARMHGTNEDAEATAALRALVGGHGGAVRRAQEGKVGLALSGGGFRASLFHIGVLARLAECDVLRHVEVLSCVSGGSIVGAYYYLELRKLLQDKPDQDITAGDYVALVERVAAGFLDGVRRDLRGQLASAPLDDVRMLFTHYTRTDRAADLLDELFYGPLRSETEEEGRPWRMPELLIAPAGGAGFSLRYDNWMRSAKVPMLVLNATALNTGHNWQFTASWMGSPVIATDEHVDASRRLRRVYYEDTPEDPELRAPRLATAVSASACVPGLFPPVRITGLYDELDVELADGGVHDNQGVASLVEQDCTVILVSDASGQPADEEDPKRWAWSVLRRTNSVLMKRVRGAQYGELARRHRAQTLLGFMAVHLTKGLPAAPRDWIGCPEPWTPDDDGLASAAPPTYGLDAGAQLAMARLRTDLDAFSDEEAYTLMAAGYRMTEVDLGDAISCRQVTTGTWPFTDTLQTLRTGDTRARAHLTDALIPGENLFFRRLRWRLKRRGRGKQ